MPDARRDTGAAGERLATDHLRRRGFTILDQNFRSRWGELDIVACDGRTLVFCEVKCRVSAAHLDHQPDPLEAVGPRKRAQVRKMAGRWLMERQERPRAAELRFDAIGVLVDPAGGLLNLVHLEGAW